MEDMAVHGFSVYGYLHFVRDSSRYAAQVHNCPVPRNSGVETKSLLILGFCSVHGFSVSPLVSISHQLSNLQALLQMISYNIYWTLPNVTFLDVDTLSSTHYFDRKITFFLE